MTVIKTLISNFATFSIQSNLESKKTSLGNKMLKKVFSKDNFISKIILVILQNRLIRKYKS